MKQALPTILLVLVFCTSLAAMALNSSDGAPATGDADWSAEVLIGPGSATMSLRCLGGVTDVGKRPIQIGINPDICAAGVAEQNLIEAIVAHELFHALGWLGHPYSGPDDVVVLMDAAIMDPESRELGPLSELELKWLRTQSGVLWLIVQADDPVFVDIVALVCYKLNCMAGRCVFRVRTNPVTMK